VTGIGEAVLTAEMRKLTSSTFSFGCGDMLTRLRAYPPRFPFVERIFADGGYSGAKTAIKVRSTGSWRIAIGKWSDAHRFIVRPKR